MDINKTIRDFEEKIVKEVNASNLPPAVVRLVLLDKISQIEAIERDMAKSDEKEE